MLFADALDLFIRFHLSRLASGKYVKTRVLEKFITFLGKQLEEVTPLDVYGWYTTIGNVHPQAANKALSYLRTMYSVLGSLQVFRGINPCVGIRRYPGVPRQRFIQPGGEMYRLLQSLGHDHVMIQAYFMVLLATGCRPSEARRMQWTHLHIESGRWNIPITKSRRPHVLMLPWPLLEQLKSLANTNQIFVFGRPWSQSTVQNYWQRIRMRAGLPDVQLRDLRRTVASWMEEAGVSITDIGQVLNHSSQKTTIWYLAGLRPNRAVQQNLSQHLARVLAHREGSI